MNEIWCVGREVFYIDESASDFIAAQLLPQNILTCSRCHNTKGCEVWMKRSTKKAG